MQPIKVMTPSFEFLGEIDDYESLQFTRRFHKAGEFEIHININKNLTETLQQDHLIVLSSNKVGVIRHREMKQESTEQLLIKGYSLQGVLNRRIIIPPMGEAYDKIQTNAETVLKHYVSNNAVEPVNSSRVFPNLIIAEDKQLGSVIDWQSRYKNLAEELEGISFSSGLGWDIVLDLQQQKWSFEVFEPKHKTASQSELPPVIFSAHFDNIKSHTFIDSAIGYKNTAFVGGQGEGASRMIVEMGESLGMERLETFIDARDLEEAASLKTRGNQKLQEMQKIFSFEAEILTHGPFEYEKDWDLGDIVTIQDRKLGITLDTSISEVKEIYESDGFRLDVTFGNHVPTLIDKIKKTMDTPVM
ncbi:siphovirus ReqiPepy6 Gp37-like family protein [Chengkuizengella sp. SCS-71B]|uniref:siphovirus ReqiPepy6 Gp37-like family protein n=1 Tax=Chengkuizengella sp. SCS-71B TaxID=3115290 RepID=UPI0032C2388A